MAVDLHDRRGHKTAEFDCVGNEIDEYLFKQGWVGECVGNRADLHIESAGEAAVPMLFEDLSDQIANGHTLLQERLLTQARKAQQIVAQTQNLICAGVYIADVFALLDVQSAAFAVDQELREADDSVEVSPDVMRYGRVVRIQFFVGRPQLCIGLFKFRRSASQITNEHGVLASQRLHAEGARQYRQGDT